VSPEDLVGLAGRSVRGHSLRSALTLLAMGIGVAAVVVLTALGEGARRYVAEEFAQLGTNLLIVLPGRNETTGGPPPLVGEVPRDLTLEDTLALRRSTAVRRVAPISLGNAYLSHGRLEREAMIIGTTQSFLPIRRLELSSGRFLPETDPRRQVPVCVIGQTLRDELFGRESPLGARVRIGDRRFRVIGVLGGSGRSLGLDLDEIVVMPVASAQALFDNPGLFRVLVEAKSRASVPAAREAVISILRERHEGEEDVTVVTQDAVLSTFDAILTALTLTLAGIATISLSVAGILIMNVMLVTVAERTEEIGLLKAVGAPPRQILALFLAEATVLSVSGGIAGLVIGLGGAWLIRLVYPAVPAHPPAWALAAALGTALLTGLVFGVLPARRAARLDPVAALSRR
jgi:putative ABC transport system permease protein